MKNFKVHLFEKIDGENQKGEIVNKHTAQKIYDCEICYSQSDELLQPGTYDYESMFDRAYITADVSINGDLPERESSDVVIIKLKPNIGADLL